MSTIESTPRTEGITITDPRDGSVVGSVDTTPPEKLGDVVSRARSAFEHWRRVAPAERGAALHGIADVLAAHAEELATLNERETGKPFAQALEGVEAGIGTFRQYAEVGPLRQGQSLLGGFGAIDYALPEPRGVAAVLTPWNDPVAVAAGLIGAALVTGNVVVHKPSEKCPHVGARLNELIAGALPTDVLQAVTGDGHLGAALVAQSGVDLIAHVGSTSSGERIARAAALTGAHVVRENGGNDALIIDETVDPEWAAEQAALGAFANAGQICTSVERIFVHRDVAEPFVAALRRRADELTDSPEFGPLVDEELRARVHEHVTLSVAAGAEVVTGGVLPEGPGSAYPATVVVGCSDEMPLFTEETFGPVAAVHIVDDFDEGLRLADRDRYGLAASVLTASLERAQRATRALDVGTVKVNAVFGGAPGGSAEPRRGSGSGFGYGPALLDEMTQTKVVHLGTARERR